MAPDSPYANTRLMGESPALYRPEGFHTVHLGDVLNDRYHVFRKLGVGSQSTVWLARDKHVPPRHFVATKVFSARSSHIQLSLDKTLHQPNDQHPGKQHVELALDSFIISGPNGQHFCKVLEPLGRSLGSVLETFFDRRAKLNEPQSWLGRAHEDDGWSASAAKQACRQILLGLDYLHSQGIAHRDIQPGNICVALGYDLSERSENEIQKDIWVSEDQKEAASGKKETERSHEEDKRVESSKDDSSSDEATDSEDRAHKNWDRGLKERKRLNDEQWQAFEPGDTQAEPLSAEWKKANFLKSREYIELLQRSDGRSLKADEIQYTVAPRPLPDTAGLGKGEKFRLVIIDLGFACTFDQCEERILRNMSDFRPPELLLGIPATHKADIFSAGLLFWEIVMLRRLVESRYSMNDPDRVRQKSRLLRDVAQRLGPIPQVMRKHWGGADQYVSADGVALDMQEEDEEIYEPDDFEYGDIWHQARVRKPWDMDAREMEEFVSLVQMMLQWEPENRPSMSELLQHKWFSEKSL